jgi:hypothetical protein
MRSFGSLHEASILDVLLLSKEIGRYLAAISPPSTLVPRPVKVSHRPPRPAGLSFSERHRPRFHQSLTAVISYLELAMCQKPALGAVVHCRSANSISFCVFSPTIGNLHLARPSREFRPSRRRRPRRKEDLIPTRVAACVCEQLTVSSSGDSARVFSVPTVSHASGEQGAPMGSPRSISAKTSGWLAMPRSTLDNRIADIPSPSTFAPIAGRPCTGSPVVNPK